MSKGLYIIIGWTAISVGIGCWIGPQWGAVAWGLLWLCVLLWLNPGLWGGE